MGSLLVKSVLLLPLMILIVIASGCSTPKGATAEEQRAYTLEVREEGLAAFYASDPNLEEKVKAAEGYIFFSNFAMHPGWMTLANGYGVLENNSTKEQTFVRMFRFGIGPGLSFKGVYALVLINNPDTLKKFAEGASALAGFVEACFRFGDFGGSWALEGAFGADVEAYGWTHTGLGIELTFLGGRVWPKAELNKSTAAESP